MDIEYQKKEVTWCLDRDGPRICLRAVAINNELQQLQISSESFSLDLKTTEAREFLSILRKLNIYDEPKITLGEKISADIVKELSNEIFDEKKSEISTNSPSYIDEPTKSTSKLDNSDLLELFQHSESNITKEVDELPVVSSPLPLGSFESTPKRNTLDILDEFQHSELNIEDKTDNIPVVTSPSPQPPEPLESIQTLDTSEILDVFKQSEDQEEEETGKIRRLGSLFGMKEQVPSTPSPDTSKRPEGFKRSSSELEDELTELTDIIIGKESPKIDSSSVEVRKMIEGISSEENVKPSVILGGRVDTASFFHKVEEKSPLEQLLAEDEEEDKSVPSVAPINSEKSPKSEVVRLEDEANHVSREIETFTPNDLHSSAFISDFNSRKNNSKSEIGIDKSQVRSFRSSEDDSRKLESIQDGSYTTEAERKKQIEKEREARKKRLWELTRGF